MRSGTATLRNALLACTAIVYGVSAAPFTASAEIHPGSLLPGSRADATTLSSSVPLSSRVSSTDVVGEHARQPASSPSAKFFNACGPLGLAVTVATSVSRERHSGNPSRY